jgi:hypothetical protein
MKVEQPQDPCRAAECGALLWQTLPDGTEIMLREQVYNASIMRSNPGHRDESDDVW